MEDKLLGITEPLNIYALAFQIAATTKNAAKGL